MESGEKGVFLGRIGSIPEFQITEMALFMAVLWSGIWMLMIYHMRKKQKNIGHGDIICIVLLYLFCVIRLLLPIDFFFTIPVCLRGGIYAGVYEFICLNKYTLGICSFTILNVFLCIWLGAAAILTVRFLLQYRQTWRMASALQRRRDIQCERVLERVFLQTQKKQKVEICIYPGADIPMGIGIRKRLILLPSQEYNDTQLYHILLHEYTHFINGDLLVKFLVHIFCCIFWWNPLTFFLKKDLDKSLEIKCDLTIVENFDKNTTIQYLETIVEVVKRAEKRKKQKIMQEGVCLAKKDKNELEERFQIIVDNYPRRKKKNRSWIKLAAFAVMVLLSYSFIFYPSYEAPVEEIENVPGAYSIDEESYILQADGTYYVVVTRDGEEAERAKISSECAARMQEEDGLIVIKGSQEK